MPLLPSHPVLTCAEARALEVRRLQGTDAEWDAMRRAGAAVGRALLEDSREIGGLPEAARILVVAGKGHNGGDALLAAATLLAARPGATADVLLAAGAAALRPLARRSWDELRAAAGDRVREVAFADLKRAFASYDAVLDGLFGFSFRPPLDETDGEVLAWLNTHPRIRLRAAVDLPSGLGEAGAAKSVFRADFTYATGSVKRPAADPAHAAWVGRLRYLDLGFFADPADEAAGDGERVLIPDLLAPLARLRDPRSDKRTHGHLLVVGGSRSFPGAPLMAVLAALRGGAGLVTAAVPEFLVPEFAARLPEAMWVGLPLDASGGLGPAALPLILRAAGRAEVAVVGPGLGADPATIALATELVGRLEISVVLDADALRPEVVAAARADRLVVTPHAGEWARLASAWPGAPAVLVRKGAPTRIEAGGRTYLNLVGGPVLARGGSGDLLAGLIGAMAAGNPGDLALAAAQAVFWHGRAADLLARDQGQVAVRTTQLLDYLHPALTADG